MFASWGPVGRPLGGLLGRLGGLLGRLEAILGVLGRSFTVWGAWWGAPRTPPGRLGRCNRPGGPRDKPWERPRAPGTPGVRPLKKLESWLQQQHSSSRAVSFGALHFVPEARWRIFI